MRTDADLVATARRRYEAGRLRASGRDVWPVLPLALLASFLHRGAVLQVVAACALLALAVTFFSWRGLELRRGIWLGWAAGALPLLVPALFMQLGGSCCVGGRCLPVCLLLCPLTGFLAGLGVGWRASTPAALTSAALVAALTGAMGCLVMGSAGVLGMGVAGLLGAAPMVWTARRRST